MVYYGSIGRTSLEVGFPLRCFQRLSRPYLATRHCSWRYNRSTRVVHPGPLVLGTNPLNSSTPMADRDRTVSRRSEPSSRTTLIGEQPNWGPAQPQDDEPTSRCQTPSSIWTLEGISLLSPAYLLSVERWPFHSEPPDHYDRLDLLDLSSRSQAGLCHCTLRTISTVLSLPSHASVTFWEATAPVKLPPYNVLLPDHG